MKSPAPRTPEGGPRSRPARGGWIEIKAIQNNTLVMQSRPARGGWIEIVRYREEVTPESSRPARGGWIEMATASC